MKRLESTRKMIMFGGAAKAKAAPKTTAAKPKGNSTKGRGREASKLTKTNTAFYNIGHTLIAGFSAAEHFNYAIPKLISAINQDEESFRSHEKKEAKQLRPTFRFARDYWNSSMSYGVPSWFF